MSASKKTLSIRELVPAELEPHGLPNELIEELIHSLESVPKHLSGTPVVTVVSEMHPGNDLVYWLVPGDWENEESSADWTQVSHRLRLCGPLSSSKMTRVGWVITKALDQMGLVVHTENVWLGGER